MDFLVAQNITKRYANHTALDQVSISVPEQSIYGLLGPNGAGKTTLIRIINQIMAPDEGELFFLGNRMKLSHTENIGYLPEERGLYKKMKVGEQTLYLAQLKGLSRAEALKRIKYWFEKFEIQSWWNKKVEELSKGMQQKIQFIITVIHEPRLLIFDEPFSGFDPVNASLLKQEVLKLKEKGATIIFSTHDMSSVEELCDNITLIDKSKNILQGNVQEIKRRYKSDTYEVELSDPDNMPLDFLSGNIKIVEEIREGTVKKVRVKVPASYTPNAVIQEFLPHASIHSFKEIFPSMNDIFIREVTGKEN